MNNDETRQDGEKNDTDMDIGTSDVVVPSPRGLSSGAATDISRQHGATQSPTMGLGNMPDEAMRNIFNMVSENPEVVCRSALDLAAVCHRLNVYYRMEYVSTLSLSGKHNFPSQVLSRAINRLPHLRRLELNGCIRLARNMRASLEGARQPLRSMDEITLRGETLETRRSICEVSLVRSDVTDEGVCAVLDSFPQLEALVLSECLITDTTVKTLSERVPTTLRSLYLLGTKITDRAGLYIGDLVALRELSIGSCRDLGEVGMMSLANCTQLEKLFATDTNITDAVAREVFPQLKNLRHLDLTACRRLSSSILTSLPGSLEELIVFQTQIFDNSVSASFASSLPNLTTLCAGYCPDFTDISSLSNIGSQLTTLRLIAIEIPDEAGTMVETMRNLRALSFAGCTRIGDETARAIATLQRLELVTLRGTAVSDVGVRAIATGNVRETLGDIDLRLCERVVNEGGAVDMLRSALTKRGALVFV